jgi:hypothetical protein
MEGIEILERLRTSLGFPRSVSAVAVEGVQGNSKERRSIKAGSPPMGFWRLLIAGNVFDPIHRRHGSAYPELRRDKGLCCPESKTPGSCGPGTKLSPGSKLGRSLFRHDHGTDVAEEVEFHGAAIAETTLALGVGAFLFLGGLGRPAGTEAERKVDGLGE